MKRPLALIIEDDDELNEIFGYALRTALYDTEHVRDGVQAAKRLRELLPHLIVLDLHLPLRSGMDLLTDIKADPRFQHTAVIIVSADPRMADMLRDQVDLVLIKPVSLKHLSDLALRFHAKLSQTQM
jgi:CheY-like chemotaxis protein